MSRSIEGLVDTQPRFVPTVCVVFVVGERVAWSSELETGLGLVNARYSPQQIRDTAQRCFAADLKRQLNLLTHYGATDSLDGF
jgi:hypothetical protein